MAVVAVTSAAGAQQPATPPSGTISGSVIDAMTAAPLPRATVTLTTPDGFGVLLDPRGTPPAFALARTVTTSLTGAYRFSDLPIGAYRLRIQRPGYEPATIDVRLGDAGSPSVSVGLVVLPVRLRAVEIRAREAAAPADRSARPIEDDARLAAVRARQVTFLSTDARELTDADVGESATLGGRDVLRSLARLPGVTPLDDWSAGLWVRGNRWDHNRVYYDGLPLFDPFGVLGRTSGVSADAIGGAFLHPGVRPVSLGGEGATRIDLRSRPVSSGGWRGSAELSQFGASGALERGRADSSAGFLMTTQHSLGRWGAFLSEALDGRSYSDAQTTVRGDLDLGDGKRIETSGLFTHDARTFAGETNQEWGNTAGRVTFSAPIGRFVESQTIGVSHYASSSDRLLASIALPVTSSVDYVNLSGRIEPGGAPRDVTTVGYDLVMQHASMDGTYESPVWADSSRLSAARRSSLGYASAWVDSRASLGDRVTLENGFRLDVGGGRGLDALRPAGSAQAAFALSPATRVSIGASRAHQYLQGIQLPVVGQGQTLPTSWIMSGDGVPVMSVDNAAAGIEGWLATGVLASANAYVRHTTGAIAGDPTPGPLNRRAIFVDASESARGVEASARRLVGRVTGLLAYSYGNATTKARGLSFASPTNRTHTLDATMAAHLGPVSLGGAYTLTSGAPYTRIVAAPIPVAQAPSALRLPTYASLDISLDYTHAIGGTQLIGFIGAQNVLGRKNATWYLISGYCDGQPLVASPQCRDHDVLEAPVKLQPTIGLRLVMR
ncbi:MAG TPA: TonB-dependent receptor [Gemmatimonadaceae bacterium]|nr:TonB-dependent receptor [Gemmatimonadaceae bacterium]